MTEEEAKQRWCPFARTGLNGNAGAVSVNRSVDPDGPYSVVEQTRCLASACMAWRETSPEEDKIEHREERRPEGEYNPPFSNCPSGWEVDSYSLGPTYRCSRVAGKHPAQGICGLAGKP